MSVFKKKSFNENLNPKMLNNSCFNKYFQTFTVSTTLACVASIYVGLGSKERQRNGIFGVLPGRKMVLVPLPHPPLSFFGSCPIFPAGKTPKIPFLGLSLLPNPMETLATQATTTPITPKVT